MSDLQEAFQEFMNAKADVSWAEDTLSDAKQKFAFTQSNLINHSDLVVGKKYLFFDSGHPFSLVVREPAQGTRVMELEELEPGNQADESSK